MSGWIPRVYSSKLFVLLYRKLNGIPSRYSDLIRLDDEIFTYAVLKYKHVMTHYLASKMEPWMEVFIIPVFGVTDSNVEMEFSKSIGDHNLYSKNHCKS